VEPLVTIFDFFRQVKNRNGTSFFHSPSGLNAFLIKEYRMNEQQKHEMVITLTHPSGAEEWYCPTCGRRFLLNWPPAYKKIILNAGDELASHSGGKGGLSMGQLEASEAKESELPDQIRSSIEKILKDLDFDDPSSESRPDS
jgi:hypothetical protein